MNKSLLQASKEINQNVPSFDTLSNPKHHYGFPMLEDIKNPLLVRCKDKQISVLIAARESLVFFAAEICRFKYNGKPKCIEMSADKLRILWCMQRSINFATDKITPEEMAELYVAYVIWVGLREPQANAAIATEAETAKLTKQKFNEARDYMPKWIEVARYTKMFTGVPCQNDHDRAANFTKGLTLASRCFLGEVQNTTPTVFNMTNYAMFAACEMLIDKGLPFGQFQCGKGMVELAEERYQMCIPLEDKWMDELFKVPISHNFSFCFKI